MRKIIGITGGIASGKTLVTSYIKDKGYEVFIADEIAHSVLEKEAKEDLLKSFGDDILNIDNSINRKKLGDIVFNDSSKLKLLNSIIHPLVKNKILDIIKASDKDYIFFEVPLLYESNMQDIFDFVINVYTFKFIQIRRIRARDSRTKLDAKKIINNQFKDSYKNRLASYKIKNIGKKEILFKKVDKVLKDIRGSYEI